MITVGMAAFIRLGQSWWQLAVAAYFAVVFGQLGLLGHDAGHQQIFRRKRWNDFSYGWWVDKHR